MKKRLRKKLHRAEYSEVGVSIKIQVSEKDVQQVLDKITELADKLELAFTGGGLGYIVIPPNETLGNKSVPAKIESLIEALSVFPFLFPDFVMGYFQSNNSLKINPNQIEELKLKIEKEQFEYKVNWHCDLWN
jgi:hypothetical protein